MSDHKRRRGLAVVGAAFLIGFTFAGAAQAESIRSQCSAKYDAAKKANTLGGQSWSQFYKRCKAELKGAKVTPAAAPASTPAAAPAATKATTAPAPAAAGPIVYPKAIDPKYASLSPGKARLKTCADQYKANKATNSNGGLKWIEKGGGYWSLCNKALGGGKK